MSTHIQLMPELTQRARNQNRNLQKRSCFIDAMRFLNQFRAGNGDYAAERETLSKGETAKGIVADIEALRRGKTGDVLQSTT